jgi:hypothetical protein
MMSCTSITDRTALVTIESARPSTRYKRTARRGWGAAGPFRPARYGPAAAERRRGRKTANRGYQEFPC